MGTSLAGTDLSISGTGFEPKALIFYQNGRSNSTDSFGDADTMLGMGFATSSTSQCCIFNYLDDRDDDTATAAGRFLRDDACVGSALDRSTIDGLMSLKSMDSDGFTLTVDDAFSSNKRCHYVALGGAALEGVYLDSFTEPNSIGSFDVTGVPFQPDTAVFLSQGNSTANTNDTNALFVFGAANDTNQFHTGFFSNHSTGHVSSYSRGGECWSNFFNSTGVGDFSSRISLTSFLSNGMRFNCHERTGNRLIYYLALKGPQTHIGNFQSRTDTNNITVTGHSGKPKGGLFLSHCAPESSLATTDQGSKISIGAVDQFLNQTVVTCTDTYNDDPNIIGSSVGYNSIYNQLDYTGTLQGSMRITSLDSAGFSAIMSDPDPSAVDIFYLVFG